MLVAAPSILFVPILFSIFGTSRLTQVTLVFIYVIIIVIVNARGGLRNVDNVHVEMARSFGASERQIFTHILLPGALPMIMAGLRLGMGRGVRAMINGEMLIVLVGLGAMLRMYGNRFDAASVYGLLLVVIVVDRQRRIAPLNREVTHDALHGGSAPTRNARGHMDFAAIAAPVNAHGRRHSGRPQAFSDMFDDSFRGARFNRVDWHVRFAVLQPTRLRPAPT